MTLKNRNRIITFLMYLMLTILLISVIYTGYKIYSHTLSYPKSMDSVYFINIPGFQYSFTPILISIIAFGLYSFLTLLFINIEFEKTQATEIIYFTIFLLGCFCEIGRLSFPLFNLWESNHSIAMFSSTITLFARILCFLALFFSSIYASSEYRQFVEQNILILFVISMLMAVLLPFKTTELTSLAHFKFGYGKLFILVQLFVYAATIISNIIISYQNNRIQKFPYGIIFMIAGYIFLNNGICYVTVISGIIMLYLGTYFYLKNLHSMYMWEN